MSESSSDDRPTDFTHGLGCDLSAVPLASEGPEVDLRRILGVDSSNPLLRLARIEAGLLAAGDLPAELIERASLPASSESGEA